MFRTDTLPPAPAAGHEPQPTTHVCACAAGVGLTVGYTHVDSLIVIDKQSAVEAFTKSEARPDF